MTLKVGDFAEGMSDEKIPSLRQGLVTKIYPDGKVLLEMGAVIVLCKDVKKVSERNLSRSQRDWINRRRGALDPVDPAKKHIVDRPTPSLVP